MVELLLLQHESMVAFLSGSSLKRQEQNADQKWISVIYLNTAMEATPTVQTTFTS